MWLEQNSSNSSWSAMMLEEHPGSGHTGCTGGGRSMDFIYACEEVIGGFGA